MTLYDGMTKERWIERRRERRDAAKASVKLHKPKVTAVHDNGKSLTVEFTRANGERVIATFDLAVWNKPPADLARELHEILRNPPKVVVHSGPR